jgi:hypothetical protein
MTIHAVAWPPMNSRRVALALIGAWSALAAQPSTDSEVAALTRDLDRYAACRREFDADCLSALTHSELNALLRPGLKVGETFLRPDAAPSDSNPLTALATRQFADPVQPFHAGNRLYSFIPYESAGPAPVGWVELKSFLIGISDDEGANWRFIDGTFIDRTRIARIIPDFELSDLPETEPQIIRSPEPVRSNYLQTTRGGFYYDGEAAAYNLTFNVTKRIRSALDVTIQLDDPSNSGRSQTYQSTLAAGQKTLEIVSPAMRGFEGGKLYSVLLTATDAATGEKVFEHGQQLLFGAGGPITIALP